MDSAAEPTSVSPAALNPDRTPAVLHILQGLLQAAPANEHTLPEFVNDLARLVELEAPPAAWPQALDHAQVQRRLEIAASVTSRLAHDVGNLLTGILGFAELSLAQLPGPSPLATYIQEVRQAALHGADWVQKLQWFARRRPRARWPTSLRVTLREEEARVLSLWRNQVVLRLEEPAGLPPVAIDNEAVRQVLGQLLDNAYEAIQGPGTVHLSARPVVLTPGECLELFGNAQPGPHLLVTIADTGTGLKPETRHKLLRELFFSTKPQHRGLGLVIVYGVLNNFQGGFRLDSAEAGGTVARVFLPVAPQLQPLPTSGKQSGPRLLVVDDDPLILRLMVTTLELAGYYVETAGSGAEARARHDTAAEPFQLVVSDIVMPQMTGIELAHHLLKRQPDLRLLFISSEVFLSRLQQDKLLYAFELLMKPFRPEALVQAVRRSLKEKDEG